MLKLITFVMSALFIISCGNVKSVFTTSEDINGENPQTAQFAIFGANLVGEAFTQTLVIVSEDPDLCSILQNPGDIANLSAGGIEGTFVSLIAIRGEPNFPTSGENLVNNEDDFVTSSFLVSNGSNFTTVANSDLVTTLTVDEFVLDEKFSGSVESSFALEIVTNSAIDVDLDGSFEASHCQTLSDFLADPEALL